MAEELGTRLEELEDRQHPQSDILNDVPLR